MMNLVNPYTIDDKTGCWNWNYYINPGGYGTLRVDGKMEKAHRYYYEQKYGPTLLHLHHKCENKSCVNPEHIQPMTKTEHLVLHNSILDLDTVSEARLRVHCGEPICEVTELFAIHSSTLKDAIYGRTYRDCPVPLVESKRKRMTNEDRTKILDIAKKRPRLSQKEIGELCGVSQKSVCKVLQEG